MGLTKFALHIALPNPKIESFQKYLFIGPHPDDIEIGCGATIAKLTKLQKQITYLICTDGRYGTENLTMPKTQEELIQTRKEECILSAKTLGVSDVRFLDLSDGNQYTKEELYQGIAKTILEVSPDVVFAPDPDGNSECHMDHLNVGFAAKELTHFAAFKDIFASYLPQDVALNETPSPMALCLYMTGTPTQFVRTTKNLFRKQKEAILCHASQYPKDHPATSSLFLYLRLRALDYGLRKWSFYGEGYRMLSRMHMHCIPEMST